MNVPKLRFGEFEGDWKIKTIGEITSKVGSGSTPSGGAQIYTNSGIPFIRSQNINNDQLIFDDATYIPQLVHEKMQGSAVQANDVLLNITGASIGRSCVVPSNFVEGNVNQHVSIIRFINGYVPHFYQKYLSSSRGQKHISSLQVGSGREGLNFQAIRTIAIPSPEINEQQKIADFLSAVDEKITALTAQKTALTQYKQGMMQRIFAQTLRFKDDNGADYPDWGDYMIGDIFKVTRGQVLASSETSETVNSNFIYPVYSSQTKNNGLMGYFNDYLYQDAITWTTDGANAGDVNFRSGKFYCTNVCGVLISENGFANQCVSEILNKVTHRYVSYVGNPKLMNNVMSNIVINLPSSIEEQQKIAQFLTECDDKINAVDAQIQSAQQWKQGLLQQMFV